MVNEIAPNPLIQPELEVQETALVPLNDEQQAKIAEILASQKQHRRSPFEAKQFEEVNDAIAVIPPKITFDENFIADLFRIQQEQKDEILEQLAKSQTEQQKAQAVMLRHADSFCVSITEKFVKTVHESKELQQMLKLELKPDKPVSFPELMERMHRLINEEKPPKDCEQEWVWMRRGIEKVLQPIVDDLEVFLKLFNIEDVKTQCPQMIEKAITDQIKLAIITHQGTSKLQYVGKGFYYTFLTIYYLTGFLKDVAMLAALGIVIPVIGSAKTCVDTAKYSFSTAKIIYNVFHGFMK